MQKSKMCFIGSDVGFCIGMKIPVWNCPGLYPVSRRKYEKIKAQAKACWFLFVNLSKKNTKGNWAAVYTCIESVIWVCEKSEPTQLWIDTMTHFPFINENVRIPRKTAEIVTMASKIRKSRFVQAQFAIVIKRVWHFQASRLKAEWPKFRRAAVLVIVWATPFSELYCRMHGAALFQTCCAQRTQFSRITLETIAKLAD